MAHQSIRFLSRLLTEKGLHVLRFDWYGSGDSGGSSLEGGTPESWLVDLDMAIDELTALADISTIAVVGLRLGAAVAARAARRRKEVDRLVLWDPIFDGKAYLRELSEPSQVLHPTAYEQLRGPEGERTFAVLGFPLTPEMHRGIGAVRPDWFEPPLARTLLVSTLDRPEHYEPLREQLRIAPHNFEDEICDGPTAWVEEGNFGTSGMPVTALRTIAEWLA